MNVGHNLQNLHVQGSAADPTKRYLSLGLENKSKNIVNKQAPKKANVFLGEPQICKNLLTYLLGGLLKHNSEKAKQQTRIWRPSGLPKQSFRLRATAFLQFCSICKGTFKITPKRFLLGQLLGRLWGHVLGQVESYFAKNTRSRPSFRNILFFTKHHSICPKRHPTR